MNDLNLKIDLGQITRDEFFDGLETVTSMPASDIRAEIVQDSELDMRVVDVIKELKQTYKIGLLSNAGQEEIDCIYQDGLDVLLDAITVSFEVGYVKPGPEIFHECTQRLAVTAEQCLFIDDSETNVKAAENLGMKTILYKNFENFKTQLEEML
jgi:putative hydrolase of the HAD superfamily